MFLRVPQFCNQGIIRCAENRHNQIEAHQQRKKQHIIDGDTACLRDSKQSNRHKCKRNGYRTHERDSVLCRKQKSRYSDSVHPDCRYNNKPSSLTQCPTADSIRTGQLQKSTAICWLSFSCDPPTDIFCIRQLDYIIYKANKQGRAFPMSEIRSGQRLFHRQQF